MGERKQPGCLSRRVRASAGFTLVELLVVLAVIALLAALLQPVVARAHALAMQSRCKQTLRSLGTLLQNDYLNQTLPRAVSLARLSTPPPSHRLLACWPPPPAPPPQEAAREEALGSPFANPLEAGRYRCPEAPANPLHSLNPLEEPARLSYGFLAYNLGRHWTDAWTWLAADADTTYIVHEQNVDVTRHPHGANILFRDGSVLCLTKAEIPLPPVQP